MNSTNPPKKMTRILTLRRYGKLKVNYCIGSLLTATITVFPRQICIKTSNRSIITESITQKYPIKFSPQYTLIDINNTTVYKLERSIFIS